MFCPSLITEFDQTALPLQSRPRFGHTNSISRFQENQDESSICVAFSKTHAAKDVLFESGLKLGTVAAPLWIIQQVDQS